MAETRFESIPCESPRAWFSSAETADTPFEVSSPPWFNDFATSGSHCYPRSSSFGSATSADELDTVNGNHIYAPRAQVPHISPAIASWPVSYPSHPYQYAQPPYIVQHPYSISGESDPSTSRASSATPANIDSIDHYANNFPHYNEDYPSNNAIFDFSSDAFSDGTVSSTPSPVPSNGEVRKPHRSDGYRVQKRPSPSSRPQKGCTGRIGPLPPEGKKKADLVRDLGACWRCRRYKKSCDGPGDCTNCMRGMFRVWPSSLGCRRGCLEDLVVHLLPAQAADILGPAARMATIKPPNWRFGTVDVEQRRLIGEQLPHANKWDRLLLKAQSTGLFGSELAGLLDILVKYQDAQNRPNALLEASVQLLDATCDIYHNFVSCAWPSPPAEITGAIATAQRASASVCKMFLTSALSGRRRDWLPSFMSMSISFVAVLILTDAAVAVPQHARELLWGSVPEVSRDLRSRLLPTITDLLRASSNGNKPFALGCWTVTTAGSRSAGKDTLAAGSEPVRSPEGMRMLGSDKAAFDGMRGLQEWIRRNIDLVELGDKVLRSEPFTTPEIPAIAPVLKLFDL